MKRYFIYNPIAGSGKKEEIFKKSFNELQNKTSDEIILYNTTGVGDATRFCKEVLKNNQDELIAFYACGGDGTTNEVVNGIAEADNAILGIVPTGSCNDFLKNYPDFDFMNLESQINGDYVNIDLLKVDDYYCLNLCNIGFDAKVNYDQIQLRSKYKNVKKAYNKAIIKNVLHKTTDKVKVKVDGQLIYDSKALLMAFGNGEHYGGSFQPFSNTKLDDGIIDIMIVKNVSILKFISIIGKYKIGQVYNNPKYQKIVTFAKGKVVEIESDKDLTVCLDGETIFKKELKIINLEKKIKFILPKNK